MKIHFCEQRTPEWHAVRSGKFTASELGPFIYNTGKVAEGARRKAVLKKIGQLNGDVEDSAFQTDDMKRGTALEPIAREEYQRLTGLTLMEVGFLSHDTLPYGCSPDGLALSGPVPEVIEESVISGMMLGGAEIKCPKASTHAGWLLDGELPDQHKVQVHMNLATSGAPWWDFFSFCPWVVDWKKEKEAWTVLEWNRGYLPPFYIRTYRDAFTEQVSQGMRSLCGDFEAVKAQLVKLAERPVVKP